MNAFNVYLHRSHSIGYYLLVYTVLFTFIAGLVILAENTFIK
jgi:hypothetical protein